MVQNYDNRIVQASLDSIKKEEPKKTHKWIYSAFLWLMIGFVTGGLIFMVQGALKWLG